MLRCFGSKKLVFSHNKLLRKQFESSVGLSFQYTQRYILLSLVFFTLVLTKVHWIVVKTWLISGLSWGKSFKGPATDKKKFGGLFYYKLVRLPTVWSSFCGGRVLSGVFLTVCLPLPSVYVSTNAGVPRREPVVL